MKTNFIKTIFENHMLIGNALVDSTSFLELLAAATKTVHRAANGEEISDEDSDLVFLSTVLLLQNWERNDKKDVAESDSCLWEFICNQFCISYPCVFANSKVYHAFREIITNVTKRHNKIMAKSGQIYYTTLLTHALSPTHQFKKLIEQIFSFYVRTLQYQYIKNDVIFEKFVDAMNEYFYCKKASDIDDCYIKSLQNSSAVKLLFQHKQIAVDFVESIICYIDALILGENNKPSNRIEQIALEWYNSRKINEKNGDKNSKQNSEEIVTDYANISLRYQLRENNLCLILPPIRLENNAICTVKLYMDDELISTAPLKYTTNFQIATTMKQIIDCPLHNTKENFRFRIIVSSGSENVYDSQDKLFRNCLVFDDNGAEITNRPSDDTYINLVLPCEAALDISTDEYTVNSNIYRIRLLPTTNITVNSRAVLPLLVKMDDGINIELNAVECAHSRFIFQGKDYKIYSFPLKMRVELHEHDIAKKYQIVINEKSESLASYATNNGDYLIELPTNAPINFEIINIEQQKMAYNFAFIAIENFNVTFDNYFVAGESSTGQMQLSAFDFTKTVKINKSANQNVFSLNLANGELCIDLPVLRAYIDEQEIKIGNSANLWHKDFSQSSVLKIQEPYGFETQAYIGFNTKIPSERYEIGNDLIAKQFGEKAIDVFCKINNDEPNKLFTVYFEPIFVNEPFTYIDGNLYWKPVDNFVGDKTTEFNLRIINNGQVVKAFELKQENANIAYHLDDGQYKYEVLIQITSFFSSEQKIIYSGEFTVGDKNLFIFNNKIVKLSRAVFTADETISAFDLAFTTYIKDISFYGIKALNGEDYEYPCYIGVLYTDVGNETHKAYSFEDKIFETKSLYKVNPIKFYRINDSVVQLRTESYDGIWFDRLRKNIIDIEPLQDKWRYIMADYYKYSAIDKEEFDNV